MLDFSTGATRGKGTRVRPALALRMSPRRTRRLETIHRPWSPRMDVKLLPGKPSPLGATWDGEGVNFAIFSEHARGVELCLYDPASPKKELARVALPDRTGHVWHGYLPGVGPGQLY